jgi:hypothetical protein
MAAYSASCPQLGDNGLLTSAAQYLESAAAPCSAPGSCVESALGTTRSSNKHSLPGMLGGSRDPTLTRSAPESTAGVT